MSDEIDMREIKVQIQLKNPGYYLDGKLHFDTDAGKWVDIEVVQDGTCLHDTTMCPDCSREWQIDYWVRIVHVKCGHALGINAVPGLPNFEEGVPAEFHDSH